MSKRKTDYGSFGETTPVRHSGFSFAGLFKCLFYASLCLLIPWAVVGWRDFYRIFGESQPPVIHAIRTPPGLGLEPVDITFQAKDELSGLDQIIIRAEQLNNEPKQLLKKDFKEKVNENKLVLSLNAKELGLHEGTVRIHALAFDRSLWSNRTSTSLDLKVDYQKPKIEVLTSQHNAVRGGTELVFYQISGESDIFSGVMAGPHIFPGFPASKLDPAFSKTPNVYFSLFSIPLDFQQERDHVEVLARNAVGNSSTASFFYRIKELSLTSANVELGKDFVENKVDPLYYAYLKLRASHRGQKTTEFTPAAGEHELIERLSIVTREFKPLLNEDLRVIFSKPKAERIWRGVFLRPPGKLIPYPFGTALNLSYNGHQLGRMRQEGVDFATAEGTTVRAGNNGIVIFAGDLGVYGKTVIIDHGFGLTTSYTHLSSFSTLEGTHVETGQDIGISGASGYAWRPEIGYQVLLHGMSVRPEEWWDRNWIQDHLEAKIEDMKNKLGLEIKRSLD